MESDITVNSLYHVYFTNRNLTPVIYRHIVKAGDGWTIRVTTEFNI